MASSGKVSSKSFIFLSFALLVLLCSANFGVDAATNDEGPIIRKESFNKQTGANKKATVEKKSDLKSSTKLLTTGGTMAHSVPSSESDHVGPYVPPTLKDIGLPVPIEDDTWEDADLWKDVPENGTVNNGTISVNYIDKLVSNERYFLATTILNKTEAMKHWVDVESLNQQFVHEVLSDSHRRAASINLPFAFPFYGQPVRKATIATGGFLYMGEHVHSWLAATQYIAPLMANFDTRNSSHSKVLYGYNATTFVIEWRNVRLQEEPKAEFTFQCVLGINGDIAFVYKNVPLGIHDIPDSGHPVKIGVSDAYFINKAHVYVRRKTIYEYHKLDMINSTAGMISNNTAIVLTALPTCVTLTSCESCVAKSTAIAFNCTWCPSIARCSDGFDRSRQEWISKQCDHEANFISQTSASRCPLVPPPTTPSSAVPAVTPLSGHGSTETSSMGPFPFSTPLSPVSSTVIPGLSPSSTESTDSAGKTDLNGYSHDHDHKDIDESGKNLTQLEYNTHALRTNTNIPGKKNAQGSSGVAMSLFFMLSIVAGLGLWIFYAYRNPTSSSGQLLIRWRPAAWRWSGGETRYTAASIHM